MTADHISYTETYDMDRDGIADLALPGGLEFVLNAMLREGEGNEIQAAIEREITAQMQRHGVDTETGEWCGDWSAAKIVRDILKAHTAPAK